LRIQASVREPPESGQPRPRAPWGSSRRRRREAPSEGANCQAAQQRGARAFLGLASSSPNRAAPAHCRHQPATSPSLEALSTCGHTAPAHTAIDPAAGRGQSQPTPIGRAGPPYRCSTSWAPPNCPRHPTPRRRSKQHEDAGRTQPQQRRLDRLSPAGKQPALRVLGGLTHRAAVGEQRPDLLHAVGDCDRLGSGR
jgi:hypothetical protein